MEQSKKPLWRQIFNAAANYAPAIGLIIGGGLVAVDFGVTGRPDLLLGGASLGFLGLLIADTASGLNLFCDKMLKPIFGKAVNPGTVMGLTGLASVAFLGGGEVLNLAQKYGWGLNNLADQAVLAKIFADAAIYKVAANFTAYTAISLMDFPFVANRALKHVTENQYRLLQTGLSMVGAGLIFRFGAEGRIFNAQRFGRLNLVSGGASVVGRTLEETNPPSTVPEMNP